MLPPNIPPPGDDWRKSAEYLEKIVTQNPDLFSDPLQVIRSMIRAMWTVCRIENPEGKACGTGFLIGPDLVITNNHVVAENHFEGSPVQVRCRFGFQTRTAQSRGESKPYPLATGKSWLAASSATHDGGLDYAILRLASKAGEDRLQDSPTTPRRGWVQRSKTPLAEGQSLYALQHPNGDTLKMADGRLDAISDPWLSYAVNTDFGSSGSPVFDNRWELVALHSRRDLAEPLNKGILFSAILHSLPSAIHNELQSLVPPSMLEVSEEFLESNGLSLRKIEENIVEILLAKLDGDELMLLACAVLEFAKVWTRGQTLDGTCELGSDRRARFTVNSQAIAGGRLLGLKGKIDLVEGNQNTLAEWRLHQAQMLNMGAPWRTLIRDKTQELLGTQNELRGNLGRFLSRLIIEPGA